MKKQLRNYLFLILVAGIIILADQMTKNWIRENLALGETYCVVDRFCDQARFVYWYNTGIAFGLFQGNSNLFKITSTIIAFGIIVFYSEVPENDWLLRLALAFETGGAIGNLIDRYQLGHVTDFISIGNFAVFNIADACINIGIAFMLLSLVVDSLRERKQKALAGESMEEDLTARENNPIEMETSSD